MSKPQRVFVDNLGGAVNSSFPDYSAFITADESELVFTSRRDNSTGKKIDPLSGGYFEDLYVSYKKMVHGVWLKILGEPVNSEEHDATAGLSNDGHTPLHLPK